MQMDLTFLVSLVLGYIFLGSICITHLRTSKSKSKTLTAVAIIVPPVGWFVLSDCFFQKYIPDSTMAKFVSLISPWCLIGIYGGLAAIGAFNQSILAFLLVLSSYYFVPFVILLKFTIEARIKKSAA